MWSIEHVRRDSRVTELYQLITAKIRCKVEEAFRINSDKIFCLPAAFVMCEEEVDEAVANIHIVGHEFQ